MTGEDAEHRVLGWGRESTEDVGRGVGGKYQGVTGRAVTRSIVKTNLPESWLCKEPSLHLDSNRIGAT